MFNSRHIQLFFLVCIGVIASYFTVRTGLEINKYFNLTDRAPAKITQWELEEKGGRWAVRAFFPLQGNIGTGNTLLSDRVYLNEEAAFSELQELAKQKWSVWFNPKNPSFASLERVFPASLLIRTLMAWSVLLYFFYFRRWLHRKFS